MMRRVAGLLALLLLSGGAGAQEVRFIGIGSGGVTGVYYPAGLGICRLVNANRRDHGLRCAVEASQGSVHNLRAVRSGALEFGLAQSDAQEAAVKGKGAFAADGPDPALRAVFSLHAEPLHLMAHAEAGVGAVADLAGKRVNIGAEGSGARALSELLLQAAGLTIGDVEAAALKSTEQAAALCERRIDAAIWPAGVPNRSAAEATATCAIRLVALEMPQAAARDPAFKQAMIPEAAYDGLAEDVPSWGPVATLVTAADTPEAVVYTLVRAVFENLDALRARHPAFESLAPERMIRDGLVAELHPGAARYYAEQGWM